MVKTILSNNIYDISSNDVILVDVRTEIEWHNTGVPDFENILFVTYRIDQETDFTKIISNKIKDKNISILLICRSGVRSLYAANLLENHGYKNCYNIEDGFEGSIKGPGWVKNNLPIIKMVNSRI